MKFLAAEFYHCKLLLLQYVMELEISYSLKKTD